MRRGTGEPANKSRPQLNKEKEDKTDKNMQFVNNSRTRRSRPKSHDNNLLVNVLRWKLLRILILLIVVFMIFYGIFVHTGPTNSKEIHGNDRFLPNEPISFVHGDHMDVIHIEHNVGQGKAHGIQENQLPKVQQQVPPNPALHFNQGQRLPNQNQFIAINDVPGNQNQKIQQQPQNAAKDSTGTGEYPYHVIQSLTNTDKRPYLKTRFEECMISILEKSSVNLHFFFVVDTPSKQAILDIMQDITNKKIAHSKVQFNFLDIDELAKELAPMVSMLQQHVSGGHPYYKDAIFFLSIAIHQHVMPEYVHRLVMLDTDLIFKTDIKQLFAYFDLFKGNNVIGIAHEQQPVYRHLFSLYRSQNRGTLVGNPPPNGLTGFNSGVLLLDLDRMRRNTLYHKYLDGTNLKLLTEKYHFKGHLGDQDFFSLLSLEHPDLFHVLPCSWNRQLCVWWRDKGYIDIFDQYFSCPGKIDIFHGNCNTPIPKTP
ncbi:xyloside xylosyltransferase 1-like [Antedon mediterranea]|uniref:xyloside xylosyltransferase 1-like n=1 Tax=Antedon mediterranea TaxID=105859 RepID=UPI003AF5FB11